MVGDRKTFGFGDRVLAFFDFGVVKLFHLAAVQADQVVVVFALVQLKHRFATFKLAALQDARLLKLCQHPVHRGQADIRTLLQQYPEDVFSRHMTLAAALEDFQNLQPRHRGLEAGAFQFVDIGHAQSVVDRGVATMERSYFPRKYMIFTACLRRFSALLCMVAMLFLVGACSNLDKAGSSVRGAVEPYRMEIVQGNVVSREQVAALPKGASRAQVVAVLGTPLLTSVFHADRWVYAFSLTRQGKPSQLRHVTVFFKGDQLERVDADELPSESEFVGSLRTAVPLPAPKSMEASPEALAKFPLPAAAAPAPPLPPARASYPPLEP